MIKSVLDLDIFSHRVFEIALRCKEEKVETANFKKDLDVFFKI